MSLPSPKRYPEPPEKCREFSEDPDCDETGRESHIAFNKAKTKILRRVHYPTTIESGEDDFFHIYLIAIMVCLASMLIGAGIGKLIAILLL